MNRTTADRRRRSGRLLFEWLGGCNDDARPPADSAIET
jgi:hypothetical protein